MTVKEISGKWHTVSKSGKVGKRGFSSEANAQAAQDRGLALKGPDGSSGGSSAPSTFESPDTQEERASLGIPPKKARPDPEAF